MKTKKNKVVKVDCDTCTFPTHSEGACPAKEFECFGCGETGHFSGSKAYKLKKGSKDVDKKRKKGEKKKVSKSRKVKESEEDSDTDSESSYRVKEVSPERTTVRAVKSKSQEVSLTMKALDHDTESKKAEVKLLVDTGVNRTLMEAKAGARLKTMVYVIRGVSECLLAKTDAVRLGIVEFRSEGAAEEVRKLSETYKKAVPEDGQVVSGGMTQSEIDDKMDSVLKEFSGLFEGFGRAMGVDPIHIEVEELIKPVQQKRRPVPLKYVERFKDLLDDLKSEDVVSGLHDHKSATGWIHNPAIADKKYSNKIRLTLDTHPMAKAVKTAKFPIPTLTELRIKLRGSNRFSALDMTDSFFQFEMDKESSKLYTFWTTKGLYKFNTLAQGMSSASAETHDRIRQILAGLDGVIQIKDNMIVHGEGETR